MLSRLRALLFLKLVPPDVYFSLVFLPDMMESILFMQEKLAAFAAFYDMLLVDLVRMLDHLIVAGKYCMAVLAFALFTVEKFHKESSIANAIKLTKKKK